MLKGTLGGADTAIWQKDKKNVQDLSCGVINGAERWRNEVVHRCRLYSYNDKSPNKGREGSYPMETVELIVECSSNLEKFLLEIGKHKYSIPLINSHVIEVPKEDIWRIRNIKGVNIVHNSSIVTLSKANRKPSKTKRSKVSAQINEAKKHINAEHIHEISGGGKGVTIAILDTGISLVPDFTMPTNRIIAFKDFVNGKEEAYDDNGHGSHVAGIAAGNGYQSEGKYSGLAPECNIVSVKILDKEGKGSAGDVLAGLQWIADNKDRYNIRVANLSIGTEDVGSKDPLVRIVEAAWDLGIVMVIAAGNNGPAPATITSPGISRKVITVGASDDENPTNVMGDTLENFSGRGPTSECIFKPDVIAPGSGITSVRSLMLSDNEAESRGLHKVGDYYIKMSGTSMAAPIVSGAVALLLQNHPELKPNDVKQRLKQSAKSLNCSQNQQGWGLLDVEQFIK